MPLSRRADVIIHHQALHQQTPKHVVKPGYRSRQFPGFLNKPPDLFCLVIRGLIFPQSFSVYSVPVYCFIAALSLDRVKIREQ